MKWADRGGRGARGSVDGADLARRPFERLLKRLVQSRLGRRGERRLVDLHLHHFRRRVRVLDPVFFPGNERSDDAIVSLGHGAYADFVQEPEFEGESAFHHAIHAPLPPLPFLYYWRASATICFLRKHASGPLHARLNVMRNVRIHLRTGFDPIAACRGEPRWALPEWSAQTRARAAPLDTRSLHVDLTGRRGKAAVRAILSAAGAPLTRSEIAGILLRCGCLGTPDVVFDARDAASPIPDADDLLSATEVRAGVAKFFATLTPEDVALLRARGYTRAGCPRVPFPEVARQLGRLSAESWRLKERRILELFRERIDPVDAPVAVTHLIELLHG